MQGHGICLPELSYSVPTPRSSTASTHSPVSQVKRYPAAAKHVRWLPRARVTGCPRHCSGSHSGRNRMRNSMKYSRSTHTLVRTRYATRSFRYGLMRDAQISTGSWVYKSLAAFCSSLQDTESSLLAALLRTSSSLPLLFFKTRYRHSNGFRISLCFGCSRRGRQRRPRR